MIKCLLEILLFGCVVGIIWVCWAWSRTKMLLVAKEPTEFRLWLDVMCWMDSLKTHLFSCELAEVLKGAKK